MQLPCVQQVALGNCPSLFNKYFSFSALQVFNEFAHRGTVHQSASLTSQTHNRGYENGLGKTSKHTDAHEALASFCRLNGSGTKPTRFVLCTALSSCARTLDLCLGLQIHGILVKSGHEENLFLNSAFVDLYAKCGATPDAKKVFDSMSVHDQVSWTSVITGFSQNGCGKEAILMFKEMLLSQIKPNCLTYSSVISACRGLQKMMFEVSTLLYAHVIKLGFDANSFVLSSLIDCYSKCGRIDYASLLFYEIRERDAVLFTSMISGYSQNLCYEEALKLFVEMRNCDMSPTDYTLSSILSSCGGLTSLQQGRQVHSLITKMGSESNVFVVSALLDMYSKCGSIDEARRLFDQTGTKNSVLWTSMITAYAQNGQGSNALKIFERFMFEGYKPDNISFTAILTACNHAGLLNEGINYFNKMTSEYGLVPEVDQYACLVDLYARKGQLRKAKDLMEEMLCSPNYVIWSSLLSYCKVYGDVELGREAANMLFEIEPNSAAPYITLASIYAEAGLWEEVAQVRKLMQQKGVRKSAGWSYIEVDKSVHVFSAGGAAHPLCHEIFAQLEKLKLDMKEARYMFQNNDSGYE
ncbi:pentatricopeptide repeat-containing protein At2g22070-like [Euphorbia lathyris]|uniref:pentatricopeptide repeat-containing protein At2g22070-like n=1 Tax=Euphorbia lathyris TaxID=212925 RepID=UPI003313D948